MLSLCFVCREGIQTSPKYTGHPNIWQASKHMRGGQTYRGCFQTYWALKHTEGCPNILECPNIQEHSCMPFYPTKWVLPLVLFKIGSSVEWLRILRFLQQHLYWRIYWRRYHSRLKSVANSATQLLPINTPS